MRNGSRSSSVVEARNLSVLLEPRSVAVIGASPEPGKRGNLAVRALLEDGFAGAIHPVNPKGGELHGLPVLRSVPELPAAVDLAVICTPARTVPELILECGAAGVRGAVVLALGFGEAGGEGPRLESELRAAIGQSGVRVIGPNTSGLANPHIGLNLFGLGGLRPGGLGVMAQSGNVLLSVMLSLQQRPALGLSVCVGAGNMVDVQPAEYLTWLADDDRTRAVALYIEGLGDGAAFLDAAARAAARKPVLLVKGGRTEAGRSTARSHTGAMSGEHAVLAAALADCGVQLVERSDELLPLAETFTLQPVPTRGGFAVLSDGGGQATLAADHAADAGIRLAEISPAGRAVLRARLGDAAAVANPVDLAGAADRDPLAFADAAEALLAEDDVGALLVVGLFGGYALRFTPELAAAELAAAERMVAAARSAGKSLVVHSMYADAATDALRCLRLAGVPVYASLEVACRCAAEPLRQVARMDRARARIERSAGGVIEAEGDLRGVVERTSSHHLAERGPKIQAGALEPELRALVSRYGVRVAPAAFCRDAREVEQAVARCAEPLAVRVVAHGVSHKTELGGVRLKVEPAEAAAVFEAMSASVGAHGVIAGALVGPMLPPPLVELLIGVRSDPVFGRVFAIGAGGTAAEVWRDVVLRVPPVRRGNVLTMLDELRIAPLLRGWRGGAPADREAIADAALALLACAEAHPEVAELEINPLFVYSEGAVAIDVRAHITSAHAVEPSA